VSEVQVSTDEIWEMAAATAFRQGARRALIIEQPLLYGLSRIFQTLLQERGGDLRIFTSRAEAEQWLEAAPS